MAHVHRTTEPTGETVPPYERGGKWAKLISASPERIGLTYFHRYAILFMQGETPITKNEAGVTSFDTREVSAIKNISVVDTQGNQYEATYPKRAKGLVKKGRARFVDETTICLARPPYHTEDEIMEENKVIQPASESGDAHLDEAYVIAKIEQIMAGTDLLHKTLDLLAIGPMNGEAVIGISQMIEAREKTNQEMISFLRHIVNCRL